VDAFVRLMNEPSVARSTLHVPFPYTPEDARQFILRSRKGRHAGRSLTLTIVRRSDGEVLGGAGLQRIEEDSSRAEVGYWLGKEHRGNGYAAEAVNVLLSTGFTRLRLHRIEARIFPGNSASCGVARRCGFRYEGRLREEVQKNGRWISTLLYSRLSSDPPVRRAHRASTKRKLRAAGHGARRR
jgi:[ribosomal protein S5]-alanine N-acetyltransferase